MAMLQSTATEALWRIVNDPKRVKCGAPDYIASRKHGMPVFYIEA